MSAQPSHLFDPAVVLLGPARLDPLPLPLPMGAARAALGFPSPAEDFQDDTVDLNALLIRNAPATFLYRAEGWSMILVGIRDGDILVVDRSVEVKDGDIVLAVWDGNQPSCKVLCIKPDHIELHSRNPHCPNIVLPPECEVELFAVTGVARYPARSGALRG